MYIGGGVLDDKLPGVGTPWVDEQSVLPVMSAKVGEGDLFISSS